jgi:beta-galactosidase
MFESQRSLISARVNELQLLVQPRGQWSLVDHSRTLISAAALSLWRAPIDNDGIKLKLPSGGVLDRWLQLGLDRAQSEIESYLSADRKTIKRDIRWRFPGSNTIVQQLETLQLTQAGELIVDQVVKIPEELPDLPRVGLLAEIHPALQQLEYYGRGPQENHIDRDRGYPLARYRSTVAEQFVPYLTPQSCGNHTETRWVQLTNSAGAGLRLSMAAPFEFSASHYTDAELMRTRHAKDLSVAPTIQLHLDTKQRGVGTGSCGPDTLPQYRLAAGTYRFQLRVRVINRSADAATASTARSTAADRSQRSPTTRPNTSTKVRSRTNKRRQ